MNEIVKNFLLLGMTKEQAKGAWMFAYRAVIFFGLGAGWGWFATIGIPQFALASDVEAKISHLQETVVSKLKASEAVQASTVTLLNRQLASTVAAQIRIQAQKRCKSKASDEREVATREIDRLQDEYVEYRSSHYDVPNCAEL